MTKFFEFFAEQRAGILTLLLCVLGLVLLLQWVAWIFGLGRFAIDPDRRAAGSKPLRVVVADLFVKVIDDFRHLLALVIVSIFAIGLIWALVAAGSDTKKITEALQAVMATLGGLVGSIIGYYFGESAARRRGAAGEAQAQGEASGGELTQDRPAGDIPGIKAVGQGPSPGEGQPKGPEEGSK